MLVSTSGLAIRDNTDIVSVSLVAESCMPHQGRANRRRDPSQSPDWRWLRAQELASPFAKSSRDRWVNIACRYLKTGHGGRHHQALEDATALRETDDWVTRAEVECWLLKGQSTCDVAGRCGFSNGAVELYAKLFFDVQPSLRDGEWLGLHVLAEPPEDSLRDRLISMWRHAAVMPSYFDLEHVLAVCLGRTLATVPRSDGVTGARHESSYRRQLCFCLLPILGVKPGQAPEVYKALQEPASDGSGPTAAILARLLAGLGMKRQTTRAVRQATIDANRRSRVGGA